jgi:hypothetical protein
MQELMNRSLGYLLIVTFIIGLIASAGCIAVPGGISNKTNTAVAGSGDLLTGEGNTTAVSENPTTFATPAFEETQMLTDQTTVQPEITENQTIPEENMTVVFPAETLTTNGTPAVEEGYTNIMIPVETLPIPVTTSVVPVESGPTGVLMPANPYPIETEPTETPVLETIERPVEDIYKEIYHENLSFSYSAKAFSYNLGMPPLIIEYTVWPEIITDTKAYTSRFGTKEDEIVTTTYPSPSAWFEVIARDKITGKIVLQDGYGTNYTQDSFKRLKILRTGDYQIDFRGNDITVDIAMRVRE